MKIDKLYILSLGIAFVFLANGLRGFLNPTDTKELIESSFITRPIFSLLPSLIIIIAIHDLIIAFLVAIRFMPKFIIVWVTVWMGIVIVVHLSTFELKELLGALEHSVIFATALFLSISAWITPPTQSSSQETTDESFPASVPPTPQTS